MGPHFPPVGREIVDICEKVVADFISLSTGIRKTKSETILLITRPRSCGVRADANLIKS
jgi:hypothetical protein